MPALRYLTAVKKEIVYCLVEFLDQRFGVDQKIFKVVKPFIALKPDADIKEFHEIICSDLQLMELSLEFNSIVTSPELLRTLQNLRLYISDGAVFGKKTKHLPQYCHSPCQNLGSKTSLMQC